MEIPTGSQRSCRDFRISSTVEEEEDDDDKLEVICGPQWNVYWVSPLRNLQYTEARLKQYASHLRSALQGDGNVSRVDAKVAALPELRRDEDAPVPLQISIEALNGENEGQCLYNGIMLSWTKSHRPEQNNFVHLPLLLCRGGKKATESVHTLLQAFFDCSIKDLTFEPEHMLWVIGFAAHFIDAELDYLQLRFNCPGLGDQNLLDFTIQIAALKEMWRSIRQIVKSYITYDEIIRLRDMCYTELQETYGVNIRMLQLIQIKWKGFLFSANGRIKFPGVLAKLLLKFIEDIGYLQENGITGISNLAG